MGSHVMVSVGGNECGVKLVVFVVVRRDEEGGYKREVVSLGF